MNNNQKAVLFTFDLKKAFDCVNHNILIQKLKKYCDQTPTNQVTGKLSHESIVVCEVQQQNLDFPENHNIRSSRWVPRATPIHHLHGRYNKIETQGETSSICG